MKILAYVFIAFGVLFLLIGEKSGLLILASAIFILSSSKKMKESKNRKSQTETTSIVSRLETPPSVKPSIRGPQMRTHMKFNVVGIRYEGRANLIENYMKNQCDPYNGMTTREIIELEDKTIYKYEQILEYDTIEFISEPDNKYDPNAIAIHHNEMGMIGYVPSDRNESLQKFLDKRTEFVTELNLFGGPSKTVYDGEISSDSSDIGARIKILIPVKK